MASRNYMGHHFGPWTPSPSSVYRCGGSEYSPQQHRVAQQLRVNQVLKRHDRKGSAICVLRHLKPLFFIFYPELHHHSKIGCNITVSKLGPAILLFDKYAIWPSFLASS